MASAEAMRAWAISIFDSSLQVPLWPVLRFLEPQASQRTLPTMLVGAGTIHAAVRAPPPTRILAAMIAGESLWGRVRTYDEFASLTPLHRVERACSRPLRLPPIPGWLARPPSIAWRLAARGKSASLAIACERLCFPRTPKRGWPTAIVGGLASSRLTGLRRLERLTMLLRRWGRARLGLPACTSRVAPTAACAPSACAGVCDEVVEILDARDCDERPIVLKQRFFGLFIFMLELVLECTKKVGRGRGPAVHVPVLLELLHPRPVFEPF